MPETRYESITKDARQHYNLSTNEMISFWYAVTAKRLLHLPYTRALPSALLRKYRDSSLKNNVSATLSALHSVL